MRSVTLKEVSILLKIVDFFREIGLIDKSKTRLGIRIDRHILRDLSKKSKDEK